MYARSVASSVITALGDTRVVLINGPRQSGKSTIARQICDRQGGTFFSLDETPAFEEARSDPTGFVRRSLPEPVTIDEVQRVPELFLAIKVEVDRDPRPGRFLLTGSANYLMLPRVADSLAGRIEINTLWPLSQGELTGVREGFIEALFDPADPGYIPPGTENRASILARALRGGYPAAVQREDPDRASAWFEGYLATLAQRDVRDIANIENLSAIPALLALLATRSMSLVNQSDLSRGLQIPNTTLQRYLGLLVALFLVQPLPAWSTNLGTRVTRSSKMPLTDSGLLGYLLSPSGPDVGADLAGPLMETFVAGEVRKQLGWTSRKPAMYYLRTYKDTEVDIVLDRAAGREVAGVEVKASSSVTRKDFRGLELLRNGLGDRFVRGVVLYTGEHALPFGDRLWAMPVDALWRLGARPQERVL